MVDDSSHRDSLVGPSQASHRRSWVDRADPRVRILTAAALVVLIALANRIPVLAAALAVALLGAAMAGWRPGKVWQRLAPVNWFLLVLAMLLPLTADGTPLVQWGPLRWTREGFLLAAAIVLKTNAIVLAIVVLLGSLDVSTLGHAMSHLRVPDKLIHLLLFTVRYVDVLHRESQRLWAAMKIRGFRPRMNLHTYRAYGYLVGMLLVRSLDRAERIVDAMKCRGFRGRFYLLDHFELSPYDAWFSLAAAAGLLLFGLAEWT